MASKCPHDPTATTGPIGMYHCPECGEMVVAGVPHPDYELAAAIELLNARGVHINTRDEDGVSQPLDAKTIIAMAELVRAWEKKRSSARMAGRMYRRLGIIPMTETAGEKWTLYDVSRKVVWGGEFKSEAQARRWRNNAELGPTIQPRRVSECEPRPAVGAAFREGTHE